MKRIKILSLIILTILTCLIIRAKLPINLKYRNEIKSGNELIKKVEEYKIKNNQLPNSQEWKILDELGFQETELGTNPTYEKIDSKSYELVYSKGFDGPYLTYDSKNKTWLMK